MGVHQGRRESIGAVLCYHQLTRRAELALALGLPLPSVQNWNRPSSRTGSRSLFQTRRRRHATRNSRAERAERGPILQQRYAV